MNKQTKIKLLKNAIRTTLKLITYQVNETISPTQYDMLAIHTSSYTSYAYLLDKVANDLEMTYVEKIQLEAVCMAELDMLLGE